MISVMHIENCFYRQCRVFEVILEKLLQMGANAVGICMKQDFADLTPICK